MGLRFRRSIKLGPGVRLNLNKGSASVSLGGRGYHYTISSTGRTTRTIGIPGTGISYSTSTGGRKRASSAAAPLRSAPDSPPAAPPRIARPGFLAPAYEKRFYEGVQSYLAGDFAAALAAFESASEKDSRNASDELFAGIAANALGDSTKAIHYLERVVASALELPDDLMRKYLGNATVSLRIGLTPAVAVEVEPGSVGAALMLAELYQVEGRRDEAIGLLQQLAEAEPDDRALKLSLCDLLFEDGDDEGVLEVASMLENDSDESLGCLILKGRALIRLKMGQAAVAVLGDCLRRLKRNPELVKEARYYRAEAYDFLGKQGMARKDRERLYADDPSYRDVAAKLR